MRAWGVRPSRSKGQNFLLNAEIVERIADEANIGEGDKVLEIGPGLGILTEELLARGASVTAIELDDTLAPRLSEHFRRESQFRLVHDDATRVDPTTLFSSHDPYRIVANLPYSVATVIIRHFLESDHPPIELIVMVQQEVAERMTAKAGDLSLLTLAIQLYTEPAYLFTVPGDA
ncbi:MAG TPA: rRNA adenine dimethyltransferase family protein, partial [Thermomicrobiales bacterium]|nr:rRNA adenine dimethyltransferase family protein [Thermomicrobiales bacterium]